MRARKCALSSDDSIRRHTVSLLAPDLLLEACLADCLAPVDRGLWEMYWLSCTGFHLLNTDGIPVFIYGIPGGNIVNIKGLGCFERP